MERFGQVTALLLLMGLTASVSPADPWTVFPVSPDPFGLPQVNPDVDGGRVVWQQEVEYEGAFDWDIFGADLLDETAPYPIYVIYEFDNQTNPAVSGSLVVWEDDRYGMDDIDIRLTDISDPANPESWPLCTYGSRQTHPDIHGHTAVWQHLYVDDQSGQQDGDIYQADVIEPNSPRIYPVTASLQDETQPAVHRTTAVWLEDGYDIEGADLWLRNQPVQKTISDPYCAQSAPAVHGKWVAWEKLYAGTDYDIVAADITDPDNPREVWVAAYSGDQKSPAIYDHIVVWQDDYFGDWDIWGYNLITGETFMITDDAADQTNPAIWENLVVWEDMRTGVPTIYAAWLDGPEIAACPIALSGDTNGDCRVNLADLAEMAQNWTACGLEPADACRF